MHNTQLPEKVLDFLYTKKLLAADDDIPDKVQVMSGDGSTRQFYRVQLQDRSVIITLPGDTGQAGREEARSCWLIGSHLRKVGAPVPGIIGFEKEESILIFEDLGDRLLHHAVLTAESPWNPGSEIVAIYHRVVEQLAAMQIHGAEGFLAEWCWDNPLYDQQVMIEREVKYFLNAFCVDLLGLRWHEDVLDECRKIAQMAGEADTHFFLHRDFQSRNIMLEGEKVVFIDFQAGRLGPLAYDLASLLIDPYVEMPEVIQEQLISHYLATVGTFTPLHRKEFDHQFQCLALLRNLQIVGAFAFLSSVRKKTFFARYLFPALASLDKRLCHPIFNDFQLIKQLARKSHSVLSALAK